MLDKKENIKDEEIREKLMILSRSRIRMRSDGTWVSDNGPEEIEKVREVLKDDSVYKAIVTDKFGNGWDLVGWLHYFDNEIIHSEENIKLLALKRPTYMGMVSPEYRDNVELMRKCASQAGIHPAMLSYAGKNVKNDFQFIASVIINSNSETFDFYGSSAGSLGDSNMRYGSSIGLTVQENPYFWMLLNAKIESINQQSNRSIPLFSIEKELSIVNDKKMNDMLSSDYSTESTQEVHKKR